jgi:SAM-dependent methyltransferase
MPTTVSAHKAPYGSTSWCEERFQEVEDDPWGLGWRSYEQERYRFTVRLLRAYCAQSFPGGMTLIKALDLGCATGHFTGLLKTLVGSVVGLDASETAIARARQRFPEITFIQADTPNGALADAPFHVMSCLEMLYYLPRTELHDFLSTMNSMLHPGGVAIFSVLAGPPPYFSREELTEFLGARFRVVTCVGFGCRGYARLEKMMFDTSKRLGLLKEALITKERTPANEALALEGSSRFKRLINRARGIGASRPWAGWALDFSLRGAQWPLRSLLSWRWLAQTGLVLGRAMERDATHWIAVCVRGDREA